MLAAMALALAGAVAPALAQSAIRLSGNHPPRLDRYAYAGLADTARPLTMAMTLKLRNRGALDQLLAEQQDPSSPNYHRWLTPNQFAAQFGPTAADLQTAEDWLAAQGFTITAANLARRTIAFTGTVGQASQAFNVSILKFLGGDLYGNADDPELPPRIAAVAESIQGLDNLHGESPMMNQSALRRFAVPSDKSGAKPMQLAENTDDAPPPVTILSSQQAPDYFVKGLGNFVGPADFQVFYNETPLLKLGLKGSGTAGCIGIVGTSDYAAGPIAAFNRRFRLPGQPIKKILVDGSSPGITDAEVETLLDLEWAHAAAPGSPLRYYLGNANTSPDGNDLFDAIAGAVSDDACPVINISYNFCGYSNSFYSSNLHGIFQQAALQGQTVFVAADDYGAAATVFNAQISSCTAGNERGVSEMAADPNVTAVGGTEFFPPYNARGAVTNYSPEQVWNNYPNGAGGGGQSGIFPKPAYQDDGTPADGTRDLPDVSLIASEFDPGALVFLDKSCIPSGACDGKGGSTLIPVGGTSLSSPAWAGIARIIVQATGARLGAFNPTLYKLAATGQSAAGLHDITSGNNSYGVVVGFDAGPGYDLASGWGTANAGVFVPAYASQLPGPPTVTVRPSALAFNNVVVGRTSLPKLVTITNPPRQPTWLVIGSVTGGGDFSVAQNCVGAIIKPGGSCRFAVRYAPSAPGPSAPVTLQIADDAGTSPQTVALTGSGR